MGRHGWITTGSGAGPPERPAGRPLPDGSLPEGTLLPGPPPFGGSRRWAISRGAAFVCAGLLLAWLIVTVVRHDWTAPSVEPVAEVALAEPSGSAAPGSAAGDPAAGDPATGGPAGSAPVETGAVIVVHVAGAVLHPGIVNPPAGGRVYEAIALAGGVTAEADLNGLNLAAVVSDGQQIYVPAAGAAGSGAGTGAGSAGAGSESGAGGKAATIKVNINRAGPDELATLPRVGPVLAQRIIDFRTEHGPFRSPSDLDAVPGIGPALLAALTPLVTT